MYVLESLRDTEIVMWPISLKFPPRIWCSAWPKILTIKIAPQVDNSELLFSYLLFSKMKIGSTIDRVYYNSKS